MAVSPHLRRKLRDTLGADAGDDLVNVLTGIDGLRNEQRELRQEMRLGFARMDAGFAQIDAKWGAMLAATKAEMEALIQKGLREQMRFFFLAWAVLLAAIVGLYAR